MYLSRIKITNFRNFSELDVALAGNVVVVGENRVGKSNLLYALRLLLDPTLPDSSRQLTMADFGMAWVRLMKRTKLLSQSRLRILRATSMFWRSSRTFGLLQMRIPSA